MLKLVVLVDNRSTDKALLTEHGLSIWIEYQGKSILFDTGQGDALLPNCDKLNIDPTQADAIVLSHGHYDHSGGLERLGYLENAQLYMHPEATKKRYSCRQAGSAKDIAMPTGACDIVHKYKTGKQIVYTTKPMQIYPGVMVSGPIPRHTEFEDTGGPFYNDAHAANKDEITDDQCLFFDTAKGTVVVLGCAHAGVINTLNHIEKLTSKHICAVLGGMHLQSASQNRIDKTLQAIKKHNIELIGPAHCTGDKVIKIFQEQFGDRFTAISVGTKLSW